ncbi:MAG: hypothetical protein ACKPAD_15555, partial [Bacteroidota bacterium]
QSFGKFIMRCSAKNASMGIGVIAKTAYSHPQWFVRLAASQALAEVAKSYGKEKLAQSGGVDSEVESVRKSASTVLDDVKAKETDPNLLRFYSR